MMAQEQGLARLERTADELYGQATEMIGRSREITQWMMKAGHIAEAPES